MHPIKINYSPARKHTNDNEIDRASNQICIMCTRQVMPKDLPSFTGNPEEWPIFISNEYMRFLKIRKSDQTVTLNFVIVVCIII